MQGEQTCADELVKFYFRLGADNDLDADWRVAPDRCVPSFGSGSQCQERWHGARLRPGLGGSKMSFSELMQVMAFPGGSYVVLFQPNGSFKF